MAASVKSYLCKDISDTDNTIVKIYQVLSWR